MQPSPARRAPRGAGSTVSGSTKATYSGTTSSGTLTVTDGTHTAHIKLTGDYTASTFVAAGDGHGGTLIHDPTKLGPTIGPLSRWTDPSHGFIAAMSGFGAASAGLERPAAPPWRMASAPMAHAGAHIC